MTQNHRAALLALSLGPCRTRERLLAVEDPGAEVRRQWRSRQQFSAWGSGRGPGELIRRCARTLARLPKEGLDLLLAGDPGYPAALERLARAPAALYLRGALPAGQMVALVGARAASASEARGAAEMADGLARAGLGVVSGGALGIDTAAHQGALAAGGATVAVLGSGLQRPYPERNLGLFQRIAGQGAVVSPFPLQTPPLRECFPYRNQIIAALASAVVVLEARHRSGAFSTAACARQLGIPLLARDSSVGCRRLLSQGAGLVRGVDDVLEVLRGAPLRRCLPAPADPDQAAVLRLLEQGPLSVDQLAGALGWGAARAAGALIRLELAGLAQALPGGRYGRTE